MKSFIDGRQEYEALGFKWLLDPKQLIDGAILAGGWEPTSTTVVNTFVKPGMVVCDIGANIGYYTLLMSRLVGPKGRVLSFEPMWEPRVVTARHCELNKLENVELFDCALADSDREDTMRFKYSWTKPDDPVKQPKSLPIRFRRLDTLFAHKKQLDFIKIDVDGYEAKMLRGAVETLKRLRPTILLEVCDYTLREAAGFPPIGLTDSRYGAQVITMLKGLRDIGYKFLREENLSPVTSISDVPSITDLSTQSINLVAVS